MWPEIVRAAVYLQNPTPNYSNKWRSPYKVFFTGAALHNRIVTPPRKPNQVHLKAYGCKAFALTSGTLQNKSQLQRLKPRAWIGYLVGYRSSNIYRVWAPSIAKVISTRDVVFDKDSVSNGKNEDLMDNLMHSTLNEIAMWMRSVELPEPTHEEPETQSFYKYETVLGPESTQEEESQPGYHQGRKISYAYRTPPYTPPPVALFTQMLSNDPLGDCHHTSGTSRTVP